MNSKSDSAGETSGNFGGTSPATAMSHATSPADGFAVVAQIIRIRGRCPCSGRQGLAIAPEPDRALDGRTASAQHARRMGLVTGSCLCGGVRYEMTGAPVRVNHCHCSRCRKVRGTAHATNLVVPLDGLRYTQGTDLLTAFKPPDAVTFTHVFCRTCGSSMPRLDENRSIAIVPMGSFDGDPGVRPERHIFVASRAAWDEITDALPQFAGPPPSL